MILIDIGNTNIVFAVSNNNKIKKISRIDTNKETNISVSYTHLTLPTKA